MGANGTPGLHVHQLKLHVQVRGNKIGATEQLLLRGALRRRSFSGYPHHTRRHKRVGCLGAVAGSRNLHVGVRMKHLLSVAIKQLFHQVAHVLLRQAFGAFGG